MSSLEGHFRKRQKFPSDEDYIPTMQECMSSPAIYRRLVKDSQESSGSMRDIIRPRPNAKRRLKVEEEQAKPVDSLKVPGVELLICTNSDRVPSPISVDILPIGTPVLARWKNYYYPAILVDYFVGKEKYVVRYFDGVVKELPRKKISIPIDPNFATVQIPDIRVIENFYNCNCSDGADLDDVLSKNWKATMQILLGERTTRKQIQFFKSQKDRSYLHNEVRTGPLTFKEYYKLFDMLWAKIEVFINDSTEASAHFTMDSGVERDDAIFKLLLQQYAAVVLLPDLMLSHVKSLYPNSDAEEKIQQLSGEDRKDYVEYLLSKRDVANWGRRKMRQIEFLTSE